MQESSRFCLRLPYRADRRFSVDRPDRYYLGQHPFRRPLGRHTWAAFGRTDTRSPGTCTGLSFCDYWTNRNVRFAPENGQI